MNKETFYMNIETRYLNNETFYRYIETLFMNKETFYLNPLTPLWDYSRIGLLNI
jgi:hypothetical protein